jgi:hypothetical protein
LRRNAEEPSQRETAMVSALGHVQSHIEARILDELGDRTSVARGQSLEAHLQPLGRPENGRVVRVLDRGRLAGGVMVPDGQVTGEEETGLGEVR